MSSSGHRLRSKLLQRLDADIARSVRAVDQGCLRAERAGYFARQGYFEEARGEIRDLQALFYAQPHPAVSGSLAMAEGLLAFHEGVDAGARDKFKRAQALSALARLPQAEALAWAWQAQIDYVALDFAAMTCHARKALELTTPDDHAARARVCLVVANALHFAARLDLAQPWYLRVREHANAQGDEATLSALNTDMASQLCDHALRASLFGGTVDEAARHAMASANSAESFEQWVGTASLTAWVPLLRAMALSVAGEPEAALALYEAHLPMAEQQGLARLVSTYLADMAWCEWRVGRGTAALDHAQAAVASLGLTTHVDDLAVAHARLGQVFRALGDDAVALKHETQAGVCWAAHQAAQQEVLALWGAWPVEK
jgi:tetratricopeptide (TPR) repeat protein